MSLFDKNIDEITLEDVREEMFSRLIPEAQARGDLPETLAMGKGIERGLSEVICYLAYLVICLIAFGYKNLWVHTATDRNRVVKRCLDHGVVAHLAQKTKGKALFSREGTQGNIVIDLGRRIATRANRQGEEFTFQVTQKTTLEEGTTSVYVPIEAVKAGEKYNVPIHSITTFKTPISGITSVTNDENWLQTVGSDEESIESLQERFQLQWQGRSGLGDKSYEKWAREIPSVKRAIINSKQPRGINTIDVIIQTHSDLTPQSVINTVQNHIEQRRATHDDVLVKAEENLLLNLVLTIYYRRGVAEEIETLATEKLHSFLSSRVLNESIQIDALRGLLIVDERIQRIIFHHYDSNSNLQTTNYDENKDWIFVEKYQRASWNDLDFTLIHEG